MKIDPALLLKVAQEQLKQGPASAPAVPAWLKTAQQGDVPTLAPTHDPDTSALKTFGKSLAGLAVGFSAGYLGTHGIDHLLQKTRGYGIPPSTARNLLPAVTGAVGLAAPYFHQRTVEKMREAHLRKQQEAQNVPPRT